jgi:P-type Cu2+ transporter
MYRVARAAGVACVASDTCFHCAAPLPASGSWSGEVDGALRAFCCAGCLAVARTIRSAGLEAYYRDRPAAASKPPRPDDTRGGWAHDNGIARRAGLLLPRAGGDADAALLLEGMTCGACVWLLEAWLARVDGVRSAHVNLALRRAQVRIDPARVTLGTLLDAVARIGYVAHPYDASRRDALARNEARVMLRRTVIAWLAMMQVMMLALPLYIGDDGVTIEQRRLLDWASVTLTLPVMLYCAGPFFRAAWANVRARRLGMDVPVATALAAAFAASVVATLNGTGVTYYDSITMFVALLLTARAIELHARQRAADALDFTARALPATAERYAAWPDRTSLETVSADLLARNDVVLLRPGAAIPSDGRVIEGASHVDESWLTGESVPRARAAGDTVLAGAVNLESVLVVRVDEPVDATQLAALTRLVQNAADARPPIARLADRIAGRFVGAMLAVAAVSALCWLIVEPSRALAVTFAVLAVSCPCALSLATPATLASAAGALARRRIVLTRPDALEALAHVTTMAFDKTGTLTHGRLELACFEALRPITLDRALAIAAALEHGSEHPLARAIRTRAHRAAVANDIAMTPGLGVEGEVSGVRWRLGRADFAGGRDDTGAALPTACTAVVLGDAQGPVALFGFADTPREDARETIELLRGAGVRSLLLSGDRRGAVEATARALAIGDARAALTPMAKRDAIVALQDRHDVVAMVGDGINDAPALATADVAVSLGSATPLAQCTADVVVLSGRLSDIPAALALARRAHRIVRQNLAWALLYNAVAVPAAALGLVSPSIAAIGMSLSSLVVIANALRAARIPGV